MKLSKRVLLGILGVTLFAAIALIALNLGDEELTPEVQALMDFKPEIDARSVEGFQYLLGFRAPIDQEPRDEGKKRFDILIRNQETFVVACMRKEPQCEQVRVPLKWELPKLPHNCARDGYCSKEQFEIARASIELFSIENKVFLDRANSVFKFGSFQNPIAQPFISSSVALDLLTSHQLKIFALNKRLHVGTLNRATAAEIVSELEQIQKYAANSLRHDQLLIYVAVLGLMMDRNRKFVEAATTEYPLLRESVKARAESFVFKGDVDRIGEQTLRREVGSAARLFKTVPRYSDFLSMLNLEGFEADLGPTPTLMTRLKGLSGLFFRPNQSANLYRSIVVQGFQAQKLKAEVGLRNPLGSMLLNTFGETISQSWVRVRSRFAEISKPLMLNPVVK